LQVLVPLALTAQRPDTTMVPRELVRALLAFEGFEPTWPTIVVGREPSDDLARFVPGGARVVGGVSYPAGSMSPVGSSTLVLALKQPLGPATESVRAQLLRIGLRLAPPMMFEGPGGFAPSLQPEEALAFCGDSIAVNARTFAGAEGTYALLSIRRSLRHSLCDPRTRSAWAGASEELPIPRLALPPGAKGRGTGGSGSDGSRDLHATIVSALSARDVVAHYSSQMTQGGWTAGRILTEGATAITTLRRTDEKGEEFFAALSDVLPSANRHEVSLRVWNKKWAYPEED
jgi:hypothetical protein